MDVKWIAEQLDKDRRERKLSDALNELKDIRTLLKGRKEYE